MDEASPRRWLLVAREIGIPDQESGGDRWALDHLFLDQDGIPTLVEVKRSSDSRIRREVVGQMLDYAANAVAYWPMEALRSKFEAACERDDENPYGKIASFLDSGEETEDSESRFENFWSAVKTNLQAGKVRMVFVADDIPTELRRIVEFLNEQMDPAEVLAIEVKQYVGATTRTLVPKLVGQTAAAQQRKAVRPKGRQWNEESFYTKLGEEVGPEAVKVAQSIVEWIRPLVTRIGFGRGAEMGSIVPVLELERGRAKGGLNVHFFVLWTYGQVEMYFQWLKTKPPFDDNANRLELLRRINEIDGVALPEDAIERRPSIRLEVLADPARLKKFEDAVEWGLEMIRSTLKPEET
jgi:hypothetical protein